jgi:hypothetical protein
MNTKTAWLTLVVGLIPMLTGTGLTQDAAKVGFSPHQGACTPPLAERAISISGRASNDGNALVDRNGDIWTVANPEVLRDYAGRQVSLKGHGNAGAKTIRVLSIRPGREAMTYSARWDDSAFRR